MPAQRRADVTAARRADLEAGRCATANLVEMLAIDFARLLAAAVPEAGDATAFAPGLGVVQRMQAGGAIVRGCGPRVARRLARHPSDIVRGWAAYALVGREDLPLDQRLTAARPFADDAHAGVREWAWMAARPAIAHDPEAAIRGLAPWAEEPSANLRRFASEATRPRGVWCAHIAALRRRPELGLPILKALRADRARYVQDSVGNWLNDAGKDDPGFVRALARRWGAGTDPATARILRRALRNLG